MLRSHLLNMLGIILILGFSTMHATAHRQHHMWTTVVQAETQEALERGQVEMGHARALLTLSDEGQALITKKIIKESLSVRATERLVKKELQEKPPFKETKKEDPNIVFLEKELSDYFGSSVVIRHKASGKGTLVLSYKNSFELEGILKKIKK